ncbi:MAG TPA: septal ring lytic transglycosylase RlpA family protein [Syntrophorhabdaceae bacterium]|nr:septal ring lytic transglycosylase RlpA family protein [Syntrophorhabdaceae bacterium]
MGNALGFVEPYLAIMKPAAMACLMAPCLILGGCAVFKAPYTIVAGTVKGTYYAVKGTYEFTAGTTRIAYKVGEFTFKVVKAPLDWALVNEDIDTIGGLPPKEAISKGRVKTAPYTVKGKTYHPMSVEQAKSYEQTGTASWYGYETLHHNKGRMTANGEVFDPNGLTAAHKYLPLPTHVKVTNLENNRSIIVRVNDRGPFPSDRNPSSGDRIIDLSAGAAKKLGYYQRGIARVRVETIELREEG